MSPTVTTQNTKQKEVKLQQCRLCLAVAEYQIFGGEHFFILDKISKDLVAEEGTIPFVKVSLPVDSFAWQETQVILAIFYTHMSWYQTHTNIWFQRNGKWEQFLETVYIRPRLFQFKRHNVSSMRWSVTSWTLPIWEYEKKQFWPWIGSSIDLKGWRFRTLHWPQWQAQRWAGYRKIWLQMFSMPSTNASLWTQGNNWSSTGIHRQWLRIAHRI